MPRNVQDSVMFPVPKSARSDGSSKTSGGATQARILYLNSISTYLAINLHVNCS